MHYTDRLLNLDEAQQKIGEAVELIREAVQDTSAERGCENYILGHLKNWANGEHNLDDTIPKIYRKIEKEFKGEVTKRRKKK